MRYTNSVNSHKQSGIWHNSANEQVKWSEVLKWVPVGCLMERKTFFEPAGFGLKFPPQTWCSRTGLGRCVHPVTWHCSPASLQHRWWLVEEALSRSPLQSSLSSSHSGGDCSPCTIWPGGSPHSFRLSCCCWWDQSQSCCLQTWWRGWSFMCSWGSEEWRGGGSTHMLGGGLCLMWWWGVVADLNCLWFPHQKVSSQLNSGVLSPNRTSLKMSLLGDDCVECWAEVDEKHSDMWVFGLQVTEGWVESSGDSIVSQAVGLICKLVGSSSRGRIDLMWCMTSRLKHFMMMEVTATGR